MVLVTQHYTCLFRWPSLVAMMSPLITTSSYMHVCLSAPLFLSLCLCVSVYVCVSVFLCLCAVVNLFDCQSLWHLQLSLKHRRFCLLPLSLLPCLLPSLIPFFSPSFLPFLPRQPGSSINIAALHGVIGYNGGQPWAHCGPNERGYHGPFFPYPSHIPILLLVPPFVSQHCLVLA